MSVAPKHELSRMFDRYWSDEEFRQEFLKNPTGILHDQGIMDVRTMDVEISENKENKIHVILHCESPDKIHLISQRHPRIADPDEAT